MLTMTSPALHPILEGLDDQQRQAAQQVSGPVRIVAGAGTGKTRTVTHRIAYAVLSGQVQGSQILPLTHSQKAAGEMRHRLGQIGVGQVSARTFHAAALSQLRFFWGHLNRGYPLDLLPNRYALVRRAIEKSIPGNASTDLVFDVSNEIGWAKSQLLTPRTYAKAALKAGRNCNLSADAVSELFKNYETLKNSAQKVDFEDLLGLTAKLIENVAEVREHVHSTYSHFVVDEFQDVDPLQLRLLEAWMGQGQEVCVVGDPRQSIYAFKGARKDVFDYFKTKFPSALEVKLVKDYRSTPEVVKAANLLIKDSDASLIGQLPPGPAPKALSFDNENLEEKFVVEQIKEMHADGVSLSEMAVLYRFNSQSARFEAALSKANIPYVVADSEKFFARPEIKAVLSELWQAGRRSPGAVGIELLGEVLSNRGFDRNHPPLGAGAARDRFEAVNALLGLVEEMPGIETLGIRYLVNELQHRASESHQPVQNGVTLSTLHKAKGLEWEGVFMVNVTEGSLPSSYSSSPEEIEEERRLAYVGVTRAKRYLYLTYAKSNAKGWRSKPSRFLSTFGTESKEVKRRSRTVKKVQVARPVAAVCQDCRTPLKGGLEWVGMCSACMPSEISLRSEKLLNWRRKESAQASLPPGEFLPDFVLWKIALKGPLKLSVLIDIPGFNESPASGFGRDIVKAINQ